MQEREYEWIFLGRWSGKHLWGRDSSENVQCNDGVNHVTSMRRVCLARVTARVKHLGQHKKTRVVKTEGMRRTEVGDECRE